MVKEFFFFPHGDDFGFIPPAATGLKNNSSFMNEDYTVIVYFY